MSLRSLFGARLSEAEVAARARALVERCRLLGATDAAAARRLLRRQGRLVQTAAAGDEPLWANLVEVLFEVRRACGELVRARPTVVSVAWEEVGGPAELAERCGGSEAVVARCDEADLLSEAEAVCALAEGARVVLALVGEGPAMAVRADFLARAAALLPPDLPTSELPGALQAAARRLGFHVRRC